MTTTSKHAAAQTTITVRLKLTLGTGYGMHTHHTDTTFTHTDPMAAFAAAYRHARFLMGGHHPDRPAWCALSTGYGYELQTMDAHGYSVIIVTNHDVWAGAPYWSGAPAAAPQNTDSHPQAWTDWVVTIPVTQTVGAVTPAEAVAAAVAAAMSAPGLYWAEVPQDAAITVGAM